MTNRNQLWTVGLVVLLILGATAVVLTRPDRPVRRVSRAAVNRAVTTITMATVATSRYNIAYCGDTSRAQELDLYLPHQGTAPHPLVIFIHGGGWTFGNKADPIVGTYGPSMVHQGIALASINYRLAPHYTYPSQDDDTSCALSYLFQHASAYQLDPKKFALFGASAGGQLAGYAALSDSDAAQPWRPSIRGVVDFYGVADLANLSPHSHLDKVVQTFLGPNASDAAAASPITYASRPAPPFLIFHGNADRHVPLSQSQELSRDLIAGGNQASLIVVNHGGHGFGFGAQPSVSQIRAQIDRFLGVVFSST